MNSKLDLTDDAIREMFERRAHRGTPGDVRGRIMATTVSMRQPRQPWTVALRDIAGLASRGRVLALVILATAALMVGLTAVGSRPATPEPTPAPVPRVKATDFSRPFEFLIPATSGLKVRHASPGMYAFTEGSGDEHGRDATGTRLAGARGITISAVHQAVTHPCPLSGSSSRVSVREEPRTLLDDLRRIAGIGLGEATSTTFDGRPALAVSVDPGAGRCDFGDLHVMGGGLGSPYVELTVPSRLVLTQVDGRTVLLQAWAGTEEDLRAWLPTATEFLASVHFAGQP